MIVCIKRLRYSWNVPVLKFQLEHQLDQQKDPKRVFYNMLQDKVLDDHFDYRCQVLFIYTWDHGLTE